MVEDAQNIAEGNFETKMDRSLFGGELLTLHDALRSMVDNLVKFISTAEEKSKEAEQQTEAANEALEEARLAKEAAERAKAEGMLQAARELEGIVEQITSASEELSSQIEESARGSELNANEPLNQPQQWSK